MDSTATLAGFFAAHAIWSVSEGETLTPILAFMKSGDLKEMTRLDTENLEDGVRIGLDWLERNPDSVKQAVLIYDGYVTHANRKMDALIVEARSYEGEGGAFSMAIPYRNAAHAKGFAVYRPKFVDLANAEQVVKRLSTAFFRGVNQHKNAAPVWKAHLAEGL